ncbi:trophoblast glycoprotein-like [Arapaima gigas]
MFLRTNTHSVLCTVGVTLLEGALRLTRPHPRGGWGDTGYDDSIVSCVGAGVETGARDRGGTPRGDGRGLSTRSTSRDREATNWRPGATCSKQARDFRGLGHGPDPPPPTMLRFPLVALSVAAVLMRAPGLRASCPPGCECSEAALTVKCVSRELQEVPAGLPSYTRTLFITGNNIRRLGPESFRGLQNVSTLCLSSNRITEVESQTFAPLRNLRSLDLSNNQLVLIHPEALAVSSGSLRELNLSRALYNHSAAVDLATALRWGALGGLVTLDLSSNHLVLLPPGMFAHLPGLRRLLLANNSLVALHNGTLAGLEQLERLDLRLNAFRVFREEALQELERPAAGRLLLAGNPYWCSCDLEDFASWLNSSRSRVDDSERLTCAAPPALRDASVRALGGRSLACHDGPVGEGAALALQTSYAFLGVVLGFVGIIFLFVLYLNRSGIKKWIVDTRDACRDVLEGYHYRYEMDSDPRLGHISTSGDL